MASIVGKKRNGRTYYYLVESARVNGEPRVTAQRYLGTADDVAAALDGGGNAPTRTEHLAFGGVAAAWRVLDDLGVADVVDDVVGRGRRQVSVGTYLALAVLHRITAPDDALDLAGWWSTTAAHRFVRPRPASAALDRRTFWRAMQRVTPEHVERVQAALFPRVLDVVGDRGTPALVLDLPDFATFVDAGHEARLTGLALIVTLDGAVPLVSQLYEYRRPDPSSFTSLVGRLTDRYEALTGDRAVTVVIGAGQNAQADLGARLGLHFVGPLVPGAHPDLLTRSGRHATSLDGLPGVTAVDGRARVSGTDRRVVVVHSRSLFEAQARGLARNLGHASRRLDELAAALEQGGRSRTREEVATEVARLTSFRFGDRVLRTSLTGDLRLRWSVDEAATARLHRELFGKQLLVTDHDDWPVADVITAYRARYHLETTLAQLGGPLAVNPSASWHWDANRIAVHTLVTVLATTVTHLMRRRAQHEGLDLSVRDLLEQLGGVQETVLRYPSTGGRPRTRRLTTHRDPTAARLFDIFDLAEYAP